MIKTEIHNLLSDKEIEEVFKNTDFGLPPRDVIKYSLLKYASIYSTGHTAKQCLIQLELINTKLSLTRKGKEYLFFAFYNGNSL